MTQTSDLSVIDRLSQDSKYRPVWLRVGQLVDGVSDRPLRDANIVFDVMQIRFVGSELPPPEHLAAGANAPDALLSDVTVLPCLIEGHAHLFLAGAPVNFKER